MNVNNRQDKCVKGWEDRWVRFRIALKVAGIEPKLHDYCRGWLLGFFSYLKPARYPQADETNVREYLQRLADSGKEMWQVKQAEESLRIFLQAVEPVGWAKMWPDGMLPKSLKERLPFLCHPSLGERVRYPYRAGVAGAFGCEYDDDLHTRAQQTGTRGAKSAGLKSKTAFNPGGHRSQRRYEDKEILIPFP